MKIEINDKFVPENVQYTYDTETKWIWMRTTNMFGWVREARTIKANDEAQARAIVRRWALAARV